MSSEHDFFLLYLKMFSKIFVARQEFLNSEFKFKFLKYNERVRLEM